MNYMILVYVGHMEDDKNIPRPSPCCLGMKARLDSTVIINTSELSALGVLQIVLEPISEQANPQRVPRAKPAYCRTGFIFQSLIEVSVQW